MNSSRKRPSPRRTVASDPLDKAMEAQRKPRGPRTARIADKLVVKWARAQLGKDLGGAVPRNGQLPDIEPVVELTARAPYNAGGHIDVYKSGRWSSSSGLIYMRPIVQNESPGSWDGTVVYVKLKAPSAGSYLVAAVFAGFSSPNGGQGLVLKLKGPWGSNTASGQSTEDGGPVAIWNANAGDSLSCTVTCSGGVIAYLQSMRLYLLG